MTETTEKHDDPIAELNSMLRVQVLRYNHLLGMAKAVTVIEVQMLMRLHLPPLARSMQAIQTSARGLSEVLKTHIPADRFRTLIDVLITRMGNANTQLLQLEEATGIVPPEGDTDGQEGKDAQ